MPTPLTSVIRAASPEIDQRKSVSEGSWNTSALIAPPRPAVPADSMNAATL